MVLLKLQEVNDRLAAGHTTAAMTLKHYIKGRGNPANAAVVIENAYLA